jgi:serine/threonine-protein kinase
MGSNVEQKIGKYEILSKLGEGGMGVVYKAKDPLIDRIVAIKMMTGAFAEEKEARERFLREARAVGRLQHPNIVTIYELGVEGSSPYMVMEFLEGQGLESVLSARVAVTLVQKLEYMAQICNALHYAHEHDIIHRDVKPANVIVMKGGTQVKLVDFGIARAGNSGMTRTGFAIGTTSYMSPEQIEASKTLDRRSDIFSAGVMMYEVLTNNLPFPGNEPIAIAIKILREPYPKLAAYLAEYPPELDDIMARALAKDREERYSTAEEFAFDLSRLIDQLKRAMVSQYVVEGRESFDKKDLTRAKELLSYVLKIDPSNSEARQLVYEIQKVAQVQQKGEHLRQIKASIEETIGQRQYDEALVFIEQALKLDQNNAELLQQRDLVVAEQQRRSEVKKRLNLAQSAEAMGDFRLAREHVEKALSLDPTDTHARMVKSNIEQAIAEQEKQKKIHEFIDVAKAEMAERRFTSAREAIKKAEALQPDSPEIQALKSAAYASHEQELKRRELEQLAKEIQGMLAAEDHDSALKAVNSALQQYPNDVDLLQLRGVAEQKREVTGRKRKIDEQIAKATRLVNENKSAEALKLMQGVSQEFPEEERVQKFLATMEESAGREKTEKLKKDHLKKAKDALAAKNYQGAIATLEAARIEFPASTEIAELLQYARELVREQEAKKIAAEREAAAELAAAAAAAGAAAEAAAEAAAARKKAAEQRREASLAKSAAAPVEAPPAKAPKVEPVALPPPREAPTPAKAVPAPPAKAAAAAGSYEETVVLPPPTKKPEAPEKPKRLEKREHVAPVTAPAPASSSGKWIGIGAAVAVVVIAVGSYFALHKSAPATPVEPTTKTETAPSTAPSTAPAPAGPVLGTLSVEAKDDKGASIDNADVFVDNQLKDTPVKGGKVTLKISAGKHQVRIEKPGYGSAPAQTVEIAKDGEVRVQFALTKTAEGAVVQPVNPYLMVTATPGATIKVDDKTIENVGPDGKYSFQVEPGKHKVELTLRGYKAFSTSITAKAGERVPVKGVMTAIPPPTVAFSASPTSIQEGQSTELKWNTQGATAAVTLDGAAVSPSGSKSMKPGSTTTYTLVAKGEGAEAATKSVTITVAAAAKSPAIDSFAASSATITKGDRSRLTWSTQNANDVSISGIGKVDPSGSRDVNPSDTTTYKLTAKGAGGSVDSRPVTVTVQPPAPTGPSAADIAAAKAREVEAQKAKDLADVKDIIERQIKHAYEAKSFAELQKVWPDMPKNVANDTKGLFQSNDVQNITMEFNCTYEVSGDAASARCSETMKYMFSGKAQSSPFSFSYKFKRVGGSWRLGA